MDTVLLVIRLLSALVSAILVIVMLVTSRKRRPVSTGSLLLSGLVTLLMLPAFAWLGGIQVSPWLSTPIFLLGVCFGAVAGFATRFSYQDGRVVARYALLFLLAWAGSLVLAQALTLTGSADTASYGLLPMIFSTAMQLGITANLLLRRLFFRPPDAAQSSGSTT